MMIVKESSGKDRELIDRFSLFAVVINNFTEQLRRFSLSIYLNSKNTYGAFLFTDTFVCPLEDASNE